MPLYDFKCRVCGYVYEKILAATQTTDICPRCTPPRKADVAWTPSVADRLLSCPGGIRANGANGGMVLSEKQMKMIKEPVWQDEKTGAITSAH